MSFRGFLALLVGAAIGLYLPDIDRIFPFLQHRSAVTHGIILPGLLLLAIGTSNIDWKRAGLIGMLTTLAVHLSFDLFPRLWWGYAMINVPFIGQLGGTGSMLWIALNSVACCTLAIQMMKAKAELWSALGVGLVGFLIAAPGEQTFWPPLLCLCAAALLASCVPNQVVQGQAAFTRLQQVSKAWRS